MYYFSALCFELFLWLKFQCGFMEFREMSQKVRKQVESYGAVR